MYQMHLVQTSLFAGVKLMKTARLRFVKHLESMPYYSLYMVLSLPGNCIFSSSRTGSIIRNFVVVN